MPNIVLACQIKNKGMKKTFCVAPADEEMELRINALNILNEYKKLGFKNRLSFVTVVGEKLPKYRDYYQASQLNYFWAGRCNNEEMNTDLQMVLESLKAE